MRFAADVVHQSASPHDEDRFCVVPVEGVNAMEAARRAAEIAAARRYEENGCAGFVAPASREGWFRATIGEQKRSDDGIALAGATISIHVWPVD